MMLAYSTAESGACHLLDNCRWLHVTCAGATMHAPTDALTRSDMSADTLPAAAALQG